MTRTKRPTTRLAALLCAFAAAPVPARADPLPECASNANATEATSCQTRSSDPVGLRFEKRVSGAAVEIRVRAKDGTAVQTINEARDSSTGSGVMLVRDIDGDGRDEMLLSLTGGGTRGNPTWALWRETEGAPRLERVGGSLSGSDFWPAGDGYTAAYANGGGWGVSFARIEAGVLTPVASVGQPATAAAPEPNSPPCALQNSSNLERYGLTTQTAQQKFCSLALPQLRARGLSDSTR